MGEARSVIEELWRIFTFYSLHGDATASPKRLRSSQFVKLLSDCGLVASGGGGGGGGLHKAEIFIAFQKEITPGASGITFDAFISVLMMLAVKVFAHRAGSSNEAFEMMLYHILSLASRRFPEDVTCFTSNPQVTRLLADSQDIIRPVFNSYAPHGSMAYADFRRLVGALELLTAFELGDIFLSTSPSVGALAALSYSEFQQALVHCALVAYSKTRSTIAVKLHALLNRMRLFRARRRL